MNKWQKLVQQQFLNNEEAVIERLEDIYGSAQEDIEKKLNKLTFDIGKLKTEYDWLDPADPERARIKSIIQSKIYQKGYQEQLKKQVDGILGQMQTSQFTTISDYLDECYNDGFIGTIFDQHGQGVPITTPINQAAMVRAVQLDSKISKGLYTKLGENVTLLKKKIMSEVSRSISTGKSFKETAQLLANQSRIGYNNAIRIARTEGHRIQTTATKDCMIAAKEQGADIVKQWDATLDGGTRESHVAVDGQIRELDEPFSNGLDRPGDPAGAAAEVINCRCALLQRARWAVDGKDKSFTKFNNFTKQVESFDSPGKYSDFKKAFFSKENKEYMQYIEDMQDKYGTKDFKKVLASMSDREYKHYSKLLESNPIYNKKAKAAAATKPAFTPAKTIEEAEVFAKQFVDESGFGAIGTSYAGVHLDVANEVNHALSDVFGSFDIPKLGGIAAPAKNTKLGKMVNSHAAYSPIRKSILMDRTKTKNASTMLEGLMADKEAITNILTHPERYDFTKLSARLRKIIEASAPTGRSIVPETIAESIIHELGHHMERSVTKEGWDIIKAGMDKYATKVSGYAVDSPSEYFAESFASYMKGEDCIDPAIRAIFDGMRK